MKKHFLWPGVGVTLLWAFAPGLSAAAAASGSRPAAPGFMDSLSGNWFDGVVVVWLGVGLLRGRKRGMSREWFDLLKWLAILTTGTLLAEPLGGGVVGLMHVTRLFGTLLVYVGGAMLLTILGGIFKKTLGAGIAGSGQQGDFFGRLEFYLGMAAGMLRYSCMLLFILAILHASPFSRIKPPPVKPSLDESPLRVPTLVECQQAVFVDSLTGRWLENKAPFLLLDMSRPAGARWNGLGRSHRRDVDDVLDH